MTVGSSRLVTAFLDGRPSDPDACWPWPYARSTQGYGRVTVAGRQLQVHRVIYELFIGPIPAGLEVDHTCHNDDASCAGGAACPHRACCNPRHLRAVTHRENDIAGRRGNVAVCKHGHALTEDNVYRAPSRPRGQCKACRERLRKVAR